MGRFLLALCVVVGCAMCGRALSAAARRRATLLNELLSGVRLLRIYMTGMFEPVPNSLVHTDNPLLAAVGKAMSPGVDACAAWKKVLPALRRRGGPADALSRADLHALDRLFAHLGTSGRDEQELLLSGCLETLGNNLDAARSRAAEADRLYLSLGLMFGLMVALIVV